MKDLEKKVKRLLIKWGNSEDSVNKMISDNYTQAVKMYPEARAAKIAEVISSLR